MRNSLVHLTSLFENATEGIVVTNSQGEIILINPSACQMFGYAPEELEGRKIEALIPASAKKVHVHHRDAFYKHPQNRKMGNNRDLLAARKDGSEFPVEVSLSTYIFQNDERYVIAFVIDITQRKVIEQNMVRQQLQLEKVTDEMRLLNAELEVKVKAVDTKMLVEGFQKVANRITAGVILASLILGASLLMRIQTRFTLFGYPALAIICFLVAAAGGIWLLFSIFFQDEKIKKKKKL